MPRTRTSLLLCPLAVAALFCAPAQAAVHTVPAGATLSSIAAADGLTVAALAAANGLSPDARLTVGQTLKIPAQTTASTAPTSATPSADATRAQTQAGSAASQALATAGPQALGATAGPQALGATAGPEALGAYSVRPGDTLSGLAAGARVPVAQMAYVNGLDPTAPLIAGTVIKLPTGAPAPARSGEPAPAPQVAAATPTPTAQRVGSGDIAAVAGRNGVDAPLASAIAWQESGFNNAMVSSANARGVMQVMPGTWDWVQANLAKRQLDPASATDNVGAGVLYLGSLLRETGGDQRTAAAAYYQGLSSVRSIGMLPETKRYVDNVMALRSRFGG